MRKIIRSIADKTAPGIFHNIAQVDEVNKRVLHLQGEIETVKQLLTNRDSRLEQLKILVNQVEPYQPTYGITGIIDNPRRGSRERARAIENWLQPVAGKQLLDIGSSLGFFSFYFADRGAGVEGWESNPTNAEVARRVGELNGIAAEFKTKELNSETVLTIPDSQFDAALVLSVFHHIIYFEGLSYTQALVKELLERVPMLIVELAKKGEDPKLRWNKSQPTDELAIFDLVKDEIDIKKLGDFHNHLSKKTRPLYVIQKKKQVVVNSHHYNYTAVSKQAYKNSPVAYSATQRRYYFGSNLIIKEYFLDNKSRIENLTQILNEIKILLDIQNEKIKVFRAPVLLDFEINFPKNAKLVLRRTEGLLASDLPVAQKSSQVTKVAKNVLRTIADLQANGLHHNDIRSWNIIVDSKSGGWLIDYGLIGWRKTEDDLIALLWALHALLTNERESSKSNKRSLPPVDPFSPSPKLLSLYNAIKAGERSAKKLQVEIA